MLLLQKSGVPAVLGCRHTSVSGARRLVAVRYQGPESDRISQQQKYTTPSSTHRTYYAGYNDDPSESLRAGYQKLKQRWENWPADDRNRTLAWGGGGLLVLYLANGLINALDRLPLLPQALQLTGFAYATWFFFRYLLFAEGRQDLSRLSLDELLGRTAHEATSDFARAAREGGEGVADATERLRRDDPVGRAWADKDDDGGDGRLSSGARGGYGGGQLDSSIKGALRDIDQVADDVSG